MRNSMDSYWEVLEKFKDNELTFNEVKKEIREIIDEERERAYNQGFNEGWDDGYEEARYEFE